MIKKIFTHFKKNWIQYGFETFTIIIGILGAFALNNWNENRKQVLNDIDFLKSLKIEIELDTTILNRQKKSYNELNNNIRKTLSLFENTTQPSSEEDSIINRAFLRLEVLTPRYKNIARNDIILAEGTLNRIDSELNQKYISYVQHTKHSNNIVSKLGETLQTLFSSHVSPQVDLNYLDIENRTVNYNFQEIRKNRLVKNALQKSFRYRKVSLVVIEEQLKYANDLLLLINNHLQIE